MIGSVESAYHAVRNWLPAALVGAASESALARIAARVPDCVETFGFEARLGAGDPRVDFGMGLSGAAGAHRHLATSGSDAKLEAALRHDPRWRRIRNFADHWERAGLAAQRRMPLLFLEIDAEAADSEAPVPSIFIGLDWTAAELARGAGAGVERGGAPGLAEVVEALEILRGVSLDANLAQRLLGCFATLPEGGMVLHIAAMLARPGAGVRLSVAVPRGEVASYLAAIGWSGSADPLERTLEALAPFAEFQTTASLVQIDLDVSAHWGPPLALGLCPRDRRHWGVLLDALTRLGLCEAAKRDALLAWPGNAPAFVETGRGPLPCLLEREIFHAKVTIGADGGRSAKAYFGALVRRMGV